MFNDLIINYVLLYILLEFYEISWQKADTLIGMLARMYKYYQKNIFLFLIMHPTFYFAIFFSIITNYSLGSLILLFIKGADIATKILLIQEVFVKKEISQELSLMLLTRINALLPYLGLILYPALIVFALTS